MTCSKVKCRQHKARLSTVDSRNIHSQKGSNFHTLVDSTKAGYITEITLRFYQHLQLYFRLTTNVIMSTCTEIRA